MVSANGRGAGAKNRDNARNPDATGNPHVTIAGINLAGTRNMDREAGTDDPFGLAAWAKDGEREAEGEALTADDIVLRSAFHLSSGNDGTGESAAFSAWGRVARSRFEAEEDSVTMDRDVTSAIIGFDAEWVHALAGVMLSRRKGEGAYRLDPGHDDDAHTVESSLTGV